VAGDTRIAMLGYTTVFPPAGFAATDECAGVATIHVSTSYQAPPGAFYQPGTPPITVTIPDAGDLRQMTADIRAAHDLADLVVVQFHWGVAGYAYPLGYMREIGRLAVDTGADLVIGNHPHLLLGVEIYRGVPICYNLNHFAFDIRTPDWPGGHDALILKSRIQDKRFVEHALVPAAIDAQSCDLSLASPQRAAQVRARLGDLSAEFGTSFTPRGSELLIDGPTPGPEHVLRAPDVYFDVPRVLSVSLAAARQIPTPP
jgi:poly-gamma-glutamate capsule biosynthesis protein CapA/YwtB (metallophosphatase superfamily)